MAIAPVLIDGNWRPSGGAHSFQAFDPRSAEPIPDRFPVSPWTEIEAAIVAAADCFDKLLSIPKENRARFLERYADRIEQRSNELVALAAKETALPIEPRLAKVELPRTTNQLRLAAQAIRDGAWSLPTIDRANKIASRYAAIGPVVVFGPNNFPFAFNSVSGGDFAAAIAAGNPVIAKAHPWHPATTRALAEEARLATIDADVPPSIVQLLYQMDPGDGLKLVSHPLIGATGFTGSRKGGLALKHAADAVGKPIYLEMGSVNPTIILPGALWERFDLVLGDYTTSALMGCGQFCTNPGLLLLLEDETTERYIAALAKRFAEAPVGFLLGKGVLDNLEKVVEGWELGGAELIAGGKPAPGPGWRFQNTLFRTNAEQFVRESSLHEEAFGNAVMIVVSKSVEELRLVIASLEGNLTGTIYLHSSGADDELCEQVMPVLRRKVGRLLNDKMPTGVVVSPAMHHGGPFPASGHPGFTAVGIPASIRRFAVLECYDNVRDRWLPPELRIGAPLCE